MPTVTVACGTCGGGGRPVHLTAAVCSPRTYRLRRCLPVPCPKRLRAAPAPVTR